MTDRGGTVCLDDDALALECTNQVVGGASGPESSGARDHVGGEPQGDCLFVGRVRGALAGCRPVGGRGGSAHRLRASSVTEAAACLPLIIGLFTQRARRGPEGARELARPEPGLACLTEKIGDRGSLPELIRHPDVRAHAHSFGQSLDQDELSLAGRARLMVDGGRLSPAQGRLTVPALSLRAGLFTVAFLRAEEHVPAANGELPLILGGVAVQGDGRVRGRRLVRLEREGNGESLDLPNNGQRVRDEQVAAGHGVGNDGFVPFLLLR